MRSICSERGHSIRVARKSYDLGGDKAAQEYGVEGSEEAARGRRQTVAINSSDTGGDKGSNWKAAMKCRTLFCEDASYRQRQKKQQMAARSAVGRRRR